MSPYDNMPLLTLFALHALNSLSATDRTYSPATKAELAFEIAKEMLIQHEKHKIAPGAPRFGQGTTK
jgi:hypothetical protein